MLVFWGSCAGQGKAPVEQGAEEPKLMNVRYLFPKGHLQGKAPVEQGAEALKIDENAILVF